MTILAGRRYSDTVGVFTVGSNGGHVLGVLNGGLEEGYRSLYPRLGLSDPAATP